MKKIYTLLTVLIISISQATSQSGTDFWFAPPEVTDLHNSPGGEPLFLLVTSLGQPTTVTISQPANPAFNGGNPIIINLGANATQRINLTPFKADLETRPTNTVLNTGLRIQSTELITSYYEVSNTNNNDIYALKGANGLGTEFYIPLHRHAPFYNHTFAAPHPAYASFDIVATEDNTVVTIYSPVPVDGHPALQQFSVTLNAGQTYSCGWTGVNYEQPSTHPSGAVVLSDKPVGISLKDDSNHNPSGGCYDLIGDQIVPVEILGNEYIAVKGQLNNNGDESVIITAVQNNTRIFIDGNATPVAILFAGETYRYDMDYLPVGAQNSVYITGNKPFYAMHITGFGCEMGQAILPPLNCAGSQQVSFVRSTNENFLLTILVRAPAVNDFTITGSGTATINPASFSVVPGTGGQWLAARIPYNNTEIPVDSTFRVSNSSDVFALGIINGGGSTGCRYGYFSEFSSPITIDAGPNQIVCANNGIQLSGFVAGGATTGTWTTNGSGIFSPSPDDLNATYAPSAADTLLGGLQFTLTSTGFCVPVSDNMTVSFTPAPFVNVGSDIASCSNNPVQLNGAVGGGSSTGLWSTSGSGTFSPNAAVLNAQYLPSGTDVSTGSVVLKLESTANGTCLGVSDSITVTLSPPVFSDAGSGATVCGNNANFQTSGNVSGGSTSGQWTTSGSGVFSPNSFQLNATYEPSPADISSGSVWLTLTSTNNGGCPADKDSVQIIYLPTPTVDAGSNLSVCANDPAVTLSGSLSNSTSSIWSSSGTGNFVPDNSSLNTTYNPSTQDITNGTVVLRLTSANPASCIPVKDSIIVTITPKPTVLAGQDTSICVSNLSLQLSGSVTGGSTSGIWSTTGTGNFTPNVNALNAVYHVSSQDSANGSVIIILTSDNNGNCLAENDSLRISILPAGGADAGNDITICANVTIPLNGNLTGSATSGFWSTLGSGGFSPSSNSLNATYTPSPADTANGSVRLILTANSCNVAKDTILITFTPAPTANPGANDDVCANAPSYQLNGVVSVATGGIWSGGTGTYNPDNSTLNPVYTPSASEISNGSVTLILTTTGNGTCNSVSKSVKLDITAPPLVSAGSNQSICKQSSQTQLQGSVSGGTTTGIWSTLGTGVFSPNNNILESFYVFSPGDTTNGSVTLVLTSTNNGKCAAASDTMTITFGPAVFADAGGNTSVCEDNLQKMLNGFISGGSTTGEWSTLGSGSFVPDDTTLNTTYLLSPADSTAGQVRLVLTSTNNGPCLAGTDTITVFVESGHLVNAGNNITACPSTSPISLIGQVTNSPGGKWSSTGTGFFSPSDTSLIASYIPSPLDSTTGQFMLILTSKDNGACSTTSDTVLVTLENTVIADFNHANACVNQLVNFTDLSSSPNGTINQWEWDFGDGFSGTQPNVSHIYGQTGTFSVSLLVKTNNGCQQTTTKSVNIFPSPIASFTTGGSSFDLGEEVLFTNTSTGQNSNWWTFGDGTGTSSSTNPVYIYNNEGTYTATLLVSNQFGCSDSTSSEIIIRPTDLNVYDPILPTGFTPNGDGLNDILYVRGGPFSELDFTVYNEWGQVMFESSDQSTGWDGTYKGAPMQTGVFIYTVRATTTNGEEHSLSGEIRLVR